MARPGRAASYGNMRAGSGNGTAIPHSNAHTSAMGSVDETAPLLADSGALNTIEPDKRFQRRVALICTLFTIAIDFSIFMMDPPTQRLVEDSMCHSHFPDYVPGHGLDTRCKTPDVQKPMTRLKSIMLTLQMLFPLLVQIPLGIVADKYGRRLVLAAALLGLSMSMTWTNIVLYFRDIFPIWSLIPGPALTLIGGGPPMINSLVFTIISDIYPVAERASLLYMLTAMVMMVAVVLGPLSAALMSINPWIPMLFGLAVMYFATGLALFIPETRGFLRDADCNASQGGESRDANDESKASLFSQAWQAVSRDARMLWRVILSSKTIMVLIIGNGIGMVIFSAMFLYGLQYLTVRFHWDWSKATYVFAIQRLASAAAMIAVLPVLSHIMTNRLGIDPMKRDLYLNRASASLLALGCILLGLADAPWVVVIALVIYGCGVGFVAECRALVASMVDESVLATVNTAMSTIESIVGMVGMPALGWVLGQGIELGGPWVGLPFLVMGACGILIMLGTFTYKLPTKRVNNSLS